MFLPSCSGRQALRIESEMQAANISAVLLAIVLWAAPSFALTACRCRWGRAHCDPG